jgi:prophage regulatory protein
MSAQKLIPFQALREKGITHSKSTLWRLERANKFPKRVPVSAGRYAYIEAEVDKHINYLIAKRDSGDKQ